MDMLPHIQVDVSSLRGALFQVVDDLDESLATSSGGKGSVRGFNTLEYVVPVPVVSFRDTAVAVPEDFL